MTIPRDSVFVTCWLRGEKMFIFVLKQYYETSRVLCEKIVNILYEKLQM